MNHDNIAELRQASDQAEERYQQSMRARRDGGFPGSGEGGCQSALEVHESARDARRGRCRCLTAGTTPKWVPPPSKRRDGPLRGL
jgi:hypothetical protein